MSPLRKLQLTSNWLVYLLILLTGQVVYITCMVILSIELIYYKNVHSAFKTYVMAAVVIETTQWLFFLSTNYEISKKGAHAEWCCVNAANYAHRLFSKVCLAH